MDNKQQIIKQVDSNNQRESLLWQEEKKLLQLWTQHQVASHYQNLVLHHLDQLPTQNQSKAIRKEIELTHQKRSKYFIINRSVMERDTLLKKVVDELNRCESSQQLPESALKQICTTIEQIRSLNLTCCEDIFDMLRQFGVRVEEGNHYYGKLFLQFDQDFSILKQSMLQYYIPLVDQFDPFLLEPIKHLNTAYREGFIQSSPALEKLFSIGPSCMYRLLRARVKMLGLMSNSTEQDQPSHPPFNGKLLTPKSVGLPPIKQERVFLQKKQPEQSRFRPELNNQMYLKPTRHRALSNRHQPTGNNLAQLQPRRQEEDRSEPKQSSQWIEHTDKTIKKNQEFPQKRGNSRLCSSILKYDMSVNGQMNTTRHKETRNKREEEFESPQRSKTQINPIPSSLRNQSLEQSFSRESDSTPNLSEVQQYPKQPKAIPKRIIRPLPAKGSRSTLSLENRKRAEMVGLIDQKYRLLAEQEKEEALRYFNPRVELEEPGRGRTRRLSRNLKTAQ